MIKTSEFLKKGRSKKKISLQQLSEKTKIRQKYLIALEKGQWEKLPGLAYTKGFLKTYAQAVGLNPQQVLALFRREFKPETKLKLMPSGFFEPLDGSKNFLLTIKKLIFKILSI